MNRLRGALLEVKVSIWRMLSSPPPRGVVSCIGMKLISTLHESTWRQSEGRILEILFWVNRLRANLYYVTTFTVPAPGSVILHGKFAVLPLCARTSLMGPSMTSSPLSSPAELSVTSLLALDDCWCSAWLPGKRIVSVKILLTSFFGTRRSWRGKNLT